MSRKRKKPAVPSTSGCEEGFLQDILEEGSTDTLLDDCEQNTVVSTTPISFVGCALMYVSGKPTALTKKGYKPVYAHHVVLCPQHNAGTMTPCTLPFALPHCLAAYSMLDFCNRCPVSAMIVPSMDLEAFTSAVDSGKDTLVLEALKRLLVARKVLTATTPFKYLRKTYIVVQISGSVYGQLTADQMRHRWCQKLGDYLQTMCKQLEPVILD